MVEVNWDAIRIPTADMRAAMASGLLDKRERASGERPAAARFRVAPGGKADRRQWTCVRVASRMAFRHVWVDALDSDKHRDLWHMDGCALTFHGAQIEEIAQEQI